jgi:AraC family cel operon transcriptional repressor
MKMFRWSEICPAGEALHVAYVARSEGRSWGSHGHDFYEIFWVDSGRGVHLVGAEAKPVPLVAGQLVFIRMRDIHGFRAEASAEPFALINIAFSRRAWIELRHRYHLLHHPIFSEAAEEPPVQELSGDIRREISKQFRELLHERRSELVRDGFLLSLARKLGGATPQSGLAAAPAWLRKGLMDFQHDPESWNHGAAGLAHLAGCSTGHLARTMRAVLHITPSDWIMETRLRRAAQLLESTGFSVAEIALDAGFDNLSHFHHCFRRTFGLTPLRYRKERSREVI